MQRILNLPFVDNSNFQSLCQAYKSLLSYWNTIINLVSMHDVDNLLNDLILQSIEPLANERVLRGAKVLDIGSGAGLPGLPLKFARPDLKLVLLEPRRKKVLFLKRVISELELENVEVVRARLEEMSGKAEWQEAFDLVTTRGTGSSLSLLPEIRPLVRKGGSCWFFKGIKGPKEAQQLAEIDDNTVRLRAIDKSLYVIVYELVK